MSHTSSPTPWQVLMGDAPWWVKVALIFGPQTIIAAGLTWVIVIDLRTDNVAIQAALEQLKGELHQHTNVSERTQYLLERIETVMLATCLNSATDPIEHDRCFSLTPPRTP